MAELTALITAITGLLSILFLPGVVVALWYFRGPISRILKVLHDTLPLVKTLELELSMERARLYLETMGAPEPLDSAPQLRDAKPIPYKATERLLELRDSYRRRLIDLTGVEGRGREASLQKLALFAVDQKKIDPEVADRLVQLEGIAQDARFGLIPEVTAHAIVTVSGSLLDPSRPEQRR